MSSLHKVREFADFPGLGKQFTERLFRQTDVRRLPSSGVLMKKRPSILNLIFAASLCPGAILFAQNEARMSNPAESKIIISALRDAYAAFNRGDIDGALKPLDPDIEWSEPEGFAGAGTYHGRAGVKSYLTQSRAGLAEGTSEPEQFLTVGSRIVVFVHAHVRPKDSSEWHDIKLADVYTIRDGRAVQMRAFVDRQQALRWARSESLTGD
jgi:uncharacterized protein